MAEINYWAVLVSGIIAMIIGAIWYGPLFGKMWMQGRGLNPHDAALMEKMKKAAGPAYFQMFIGALLMAFVFAHVLWAFGASLTDKLTPVSAGLQGGFYMWLGFILPVKYGDKLWNNKAFKYVAIDITYWLILLLVNGIVLASWK